MFKKGTVEYQEQECIPVGCVPAARRPYSGVCFPGGGGVLPPARGGWSAWSGGDGLPGPGGGGSACLETPPL